MDAPAAVGSRRSLLIEAAAIAVVWAVAVWFRAAHPKPFGLDRDWDAVVGAAPNSPVHAIAGAFAVIGTGLPAVLMTATVAVLLGALRGWGWALFTVAASLVSELDVLALKVLAMRTRPDSAFGIGTSFPSGHTANAALLGIVVILAVRRLVVRVPVVAYVLAMAWSRTALHAHWLTDVLGGLVIGGAAGLLLHAVLSHLLARPEARRQAVRPHQGGPLLETVSDADARSSGSGTPAHPRRTA